MDAQKLLSEMKAIINSHHIPCVTQEIHDLSTLSTPVVLIAQA